MWFLLIKMKLYSKFTSLSSSSSLPAPIRLSLLPQAVKIHLISNSYIIWSTSLQPVFTEPILWISLHLCRPLCVCNLPCYWSDLLPSTTRSSRYPEVLSPSAGSSVSVQTSGWIPPSSYLYEPKLNEDTSQRRWCLIAIVVSCHSVTTNQLLISLLNFQSFRIISYLKPSWACWNNHFWLLLIKLAGWEH